MAEFIKIDPEESIAAIHWRGKWRFVYDIDTMFLLDYPSYDETYSPEDGEFRYGTLIVSESNVEQWLDSMSGELTVDQIPYARWDEDEQVQLTFLIDFDIKLWVGHLWQNDQSNYAEYQPAGWISVDDDVHRHLPANLSKQWDLQLIKDALVVTIDALDYIIIVPNSRAGNSGTFGRMIDTSVAVVQITFTQINFEADTIRKETIYKKVIGELPNFHGKDLDLNISYVIHANRSITIKIALYIFGDYRMIKHIDEFTIQTF